MKNPIFYLIILCFISTQSQTPKNLSPSEIYHRVQKLNTIGSALYIAAHPDDENTRLISYFANHLHLHTSYFSFTRGNGGQNLISEKLGEELGIIRTYELLNARKIDGGHQYFSTADDFGYSKLPYEAYNLWEKDLMLDQLVYAIRTLQPDIIVNRFDHRKEGITHGHHTASAQLSEKAFILAADPNYTTKIAPSTPWQSKRLFFNVSHWFFGGKSQFEKADKSNYHTLDIGIYYPLLGQSNQEIASKSRSQHQSQGFGDMSSRGSDIEYIEQISGIHLPKSSQNILENIDTSWKRIPYSENIQKSINTLIENFDFINVENNLTLLTNIHQQLQKLPNSYYKKLKTKEVEEIILACLGLYAEFSVSQKYFTNDTPITVKYEFSNRSNQAIKISDIEILGSKFSQNINLEPHQSKINYLEEIPLNQHLNTSIKWQEKKENYFVSQFSRKENARYFLEYNNLKIEVQIPIIYKYKDEIKGEIHQPFHIIDPISISFLESTYYGKNKKTSLEIKNLSKPITGEIQWIQDSKIIDSQSITLGTQETKHIEKEINTNSSLPIFARFSTPHNNYENSIEWIEYPHIPNQYYYKKAKTNIINTQSLQYTPKNIGYIMGAGDEIPKYLQQLGYSVTLLKDEEIHYNQIKKFSTIIVGIRAYNTREIFKHNKKEIMKYIENGGNWIVQYQTNQNLIIEDFAPFSLKISRDRITDENAPVTFLSASHHFLNKPNKITPSDFKNWTQEQGLYYISEADQNFEHLIQSNDPYEPPTQGALVTCKYGKGQFTYTGLSFFRQIPHGNIGAMKLLINLIENEK